METKKTAEKAAETSAWDRKRVVNLPRANPGEAKTEFVMINGKGYYVPKGKPVEVPEPVAERLDLMMLARNAEQDLLERINTNESLSG